MANILLEFRNWISKSATSVEFWVVATTVLLLVKFSVGSLGRRFMVTYGKVINPGINLLGTLSYYCVSYALGLMQPSSSSSSTPTTNDWFHIWAVLIVTMQDSVNFGRPYKPKEVTMVDLLASLWSANQLREQPAVYLKVPLWLIWSTRVSRIIWYYRSSVTAQSSMDNMKLVSDYMAENASSDACPATMAGYAYLVLGEEQQLLTIEKPSFRLKLELDTSRGIMDLITVERVWSLSLADNGVDRLIGREADGDNRFKDVCLSFALYKLLRRRFFDFPITEARDPKTRRLVCNAILDDRNGYERAFRVTEVELSFLRDFTYGKHEAVFAHGFPTVRLLLSLLMTGGVLFLAVAARDIPSASSTRADIAGVTHGQLITRCIIVIIVWREIWEIGIYVLSQWTKLMIICHYARLRVRQQCSLRSTRILILLYHHLPCLIMEAMARIMWRLISRGRWDQKIQQYNLLLSARAESQIWGHSSLISLRRRRMVELELGVEAKRMLFDSIKSVGPQDRSLKPNIRRAFPECSRIIEHLLGELEGETHKVLVWHVATCLCQIELLEEARQPSSMYLHPTRPFIGGSNQARAPPRYSVAVSLSNYCAYLATQGLLPGNGSLAKKVIATVRHEARRALRGCDTPREIYDTLRRSLMAANELDHRTIIQMGAQLSALLMSTCGDRDNLWERLGTFWAWFLLHLSASTPADKHGLHLIKSQAELTTHLWALLSHAGFLGDDGGRPRRESTASRGHP